MKILFSVVTTSALVLMLSACDLEDESRPVSSTPPQISEPYLITDSSLYTPNVTGQIADFDLTATFTNLQENPIYVATCGADLPFHVWQKYIDGSWQVVNEVLEYACASELQLNELAPQETLTKNFRVYFEMPYELTGFYRLQWTSVFPEANINAKPVSEGQRVSNYFEIK